MDLTPEEQRRISQEEQVRHATRMAIEVEADRQRAAAIARRFRRGVLGFFLGVVVVGLACWGIVKTEQRKAAPTTIQP
jgi:hypothetical protein